MKLLEIDLKLDIWDNKEYKIETICNIKVFVKETVDQLLGLYYLISWKGYVAKKSI